MENNNQIEAFNKVIAGSGIQIELWRDYAEEKWKAKIDTSVHDKQIRADERARTIDECLAIVQKIKDDYNDAKTGERVPINYGTICGIIIQLERLKEQKDEE